MRLLACVVVFAALLNGGEIRFEERTRESGLHFFLRNGATGGYHQIELMLGGVAALDYNNDGCMDVYFTNGARLSNLSKDGPQFLNRLFRNNCDLTFSDVTAQAGVAGEGYSMAAATADYDNDGDPDIFVAGVNRNMLFRNEGDGRFTDVARSSGLEGSDPEYGKMWSISAGWFDADNDGLLDLFVSNYVEWSAATEPSCGPPGRRLYCHPDNYAARPHQLFHNQGDGGFRDVSRESGIAAHLGKGMGVAFGDFDDDGRTDVFVANDSMRNFLFRNRGNLKFEEVGFETGVALGEQGRPVASMGPDFRDFDDDGRPDIVLTAMLNDTFLVFRNLGGPHFFEDYTIQTGLAAATRVLTGWGMGLMDLDNDGAKDLFTANSHFPGIGRYVGTQSALSNSVFQGMGNGTFRDVSETSGDDLRKPAYHRCPAFADFDNDGRVDIVVSAVNAPARLLRNATADSGHWLAIRLVGRESNRDGLGAKIRLRLPNGRTLFNHATTSVGYASSSEPYVRFGLGKHESADEVTVQWPSGITQSMKGVASDRLIRIEEPGP